MSSSARLSGLLWLACVALALAAPAGASAQSSTLAFGTCGSRQVFELTPGLQCATLDVPFDRADPAVGDIGLAVQRVPARAPRTGVIVLLAGGPGQPALPAFEEFLAPLSREAALRGFELVAVDQRGTGQSEGLQCPETLEARKATLTSILGTCGNALGATRGFYSSQESVEDLNALREALGGTPLSLFAVSYGTRVAGMYAREYPQGVARMVLDSPVPTTGMPSLDRQRLRALPRVLNAGICGPGACGSFSSDVYADLTRVVVVLHRHALHARIYDGRGRLRSVSVTEAGLFGLLDGLDTDQGTRELAPAAIAAAAHGDFVPLARLTQSAQKDSPEAVVVSPAIRTMLPTASRSNDNLGEASVVAEAPESDAADSIALLAATSCVESELPWSPDSPPAGRSAILSSWLASLPASTTAPFAPATVALQSDISVCEGWPATPPAPPSPAGVSATSTLILSGEDDLRTPYEQALTIASNYSDARLLQIPDVGHSTVTTDSSGCAKGAMIEFLTSGNAPVSCPASKEPQALPLPPASLSQVPPLPARSRLVGQVIAAVTLTLEDLYGQQGISGGGLRGGYWLLQRHDAILHDFTDVPGVTISGRISPKGVRFFIHGQLTGTLTQTGLSVTGRIGGTPVHIRLVAT